VVANRAVIVAHYAVSVKPPPVTPSPAATLVLVRDRPGETIEILLMQRHRASKFAAGEFAFPGGKLEADDNPPDAETWCAALPLAGPARTTSLPEAAARVLDLADAPEAALGYWIGAIRETFEEVGLLLARDTMGAEPRLDHPRFADYRRACQEDNRAFWAMVRAEKFTLATDRLVYFAHWITPEDQPYRFDTRFFAAPAPAGQEAVRDDREAIDLRWLAPEAALQALERREISLRTPTAKNLALFAGARSTVEALARLRGRRVRTIQPRIVVENGVRRVILPDDVADV
jgi:8-oxo-dGTP pyrophosphatase MutT (NUDIX family)